jgi:alginate O-acetyltransferase complex protein AlgI
MGDASNTRSKKIWFWTSIIINVGFLFIFKYYNFFITSFSEGMSLLGLKVNPFTLKVILPIGISFYTFHGLSYVIDIYKNKIKPEKNFIDYAVFVSFFPLLVAGPIERATHLLPQLKRVREFNYSKAVDGLRQILWGLFKKIVIADSCAQFANMLFDHNSNYSGLTNALGAVFFAIQIYGDFSGYSDIALGTARLFGIELLKNFSFPYFSRDIAEFWRRWHISLSTWFRDYLYIPLGGSKGKTWTKVKNTFIIFLVSGFWHGANWTFIIWGLLNALYIMPSIIFNSNRNNLDIVAKGKYFPSIKDFFNICLTFSLTTFAWIFFRSENLTSAILYIKNMGNGLLLDGNYFQVISFIQNKVGYLLPIIIFLFIIVEWIGRESNYAIEHIGIKLPAPIVWTLYYIMAATTFYFSGTEQTFIYFQF